jgi:hypothetical protein
MEPPEPVNWFVLFDLLVPFGVAFGGLVWYDLSLRRARRRARLSQAHQANLDSPKN